MTLTGYKRSEVIKAMSQHNSKVDESNRWSIDLLVAVIQIIYLIIIFSVY